MKNISDVSLLSYIKLKSSSTKTLYWLIQLHLVALLKPLLISELYLMCAVTTITVIQIMLTPFTKCKRLL